MFKKWLFSILLVLSTPVLATIEVKDELSTLTLEKAPQRVVALEFSFVDALANLHISPVGVADDGDVNRVIEPIRDKISDWTSVGSRSQPSLEVIASLKPDLIIADVERHEAIYEDLKRIAPTLILKSRGETYEDNLAAGIKVAAAFDREAEMQKKVNAHHQRMDEVAARINKKATVMFAVSTAKGVWMHGPKAYAGGVVSRLGLSSPITEDNGKAYISTTLENLVRLNPDYFLVGEYGTETTVDKYKENPLWPMMTSVKNEQYVETDARLWSLNRGMIAAEIMASEIEHLLK
ncbi:iron siderophore-binding protein [Vibrio nigripulchritudo]|uniref:Fe(3+) dicitrate ABC transporter substrate-binding protein n=1 Tax=Vibrio nigripulchritudo TaxID=28173 RepID=UPI00190AFE2B|nr:Fe(3+) dicitrate ABC transporter substrate-binding protein [Vibrio nigripulchritudo]BCL73615.1 iron siderophore-binding protein [Vibrio nigripulchritudo]BDU34983.1 iron siderophore-binding protein [Vibrio nigripulchritudo]